MRIHSLHAAADKLMVYTSLPALKGVTIYNVTLSRLRSKECAVLQVSCTTPHSTL